MHILLFSSQYKCKAGVTKSPIRYRPMQNVKLYSMNPWKNKVKNVFTTLVIAWLLFQKNSLAQTVFLSNWVFPDVRILFSLEYKTRFAVLLTITEGLEKSCMSCLLERWHRMEKWFVAHWHFPLNMWTSDIKVNWTNLKPVLPLSTGKIDNSTRLQKFTHATESTVKSLMPTCCPTCQYHTASHFTYLLLYCYL